MSANDIFDVAAGIVTVAMVTVLVSSPQTSDVINALGNAFSESVSAAMGQYG